MYLIFWERGVWGGGLVEETSTGREMERGGGGGDKGEKIVKGMERDERRKQGLGEDRDGERQGG